MDSDKKLRTPKQSRSKETKNKIIKTALKLFSEKGYNNTSSNEIATNSGVSIGSFYAYFKDKKQLFLEVFEDYCTYIKKTIYSNINKDAKNLEDFIYSSIDITVEAHKYNSKFYKEAMIMALSDNEIKNFINNQTKFEFEFFKSCINLYKNELDIKNFDTALFLIYNTIENTVHLIVFSDAKIDKETLIHELVKMILKYIEYKT